MTALTWDVVGERRYETGLDRGVLYSPTGAVPWNGLVSVDESSSRESKSYYTDGIKYLERQVPGNYQASLKAFTYPDALEPLLGVSEYEPGVFLYDQPGGVFSLSYRTRVGNDVEGTEYGYKLHVVYNVMATPGNSSYGTLSDSPSANLFEWSLSATPPQMLGVRPTSHISLSSREINPTLLTQVEDRLYGTDEAEPDLPSMIELLDLVSAFYAEAP